MFLTTSKDMTLKVFTLTSKYPQINEDHSIKFDRATDDIDCVLSLTQTNFMTYSSDNKSVILKNPIIFNPRTLQDSFQNVELLTYGKHRLVKYLTP
jgi:hypothetical protein